MHKTLALLLLGLALPLASAAAERIAALPCADSPCADGGRRPDHRALDSNKDGFLSRDEAKAAPRLLRRFERIDADRDGRLSLDELQRARPQHGPQRADTNKDGYISRQEALEFRPLLERFDKVDSNHDGMLSQDELHAARPRHPEYGRHGTGDKDGPQR